MKDLLKEFGRSSKYANLLQDTISVNEYNCLKLLQRHKLIASVQFEVKDFPKMQRVEFAVYSIDDKCMFRKILKERKIN